MAAPRLPDISARLRVRPLLALVVLVAAAPGLVRADSPRAVAVALLACLLAALLAHFAVASPLDKLIRAIPPSLRHGPAAARRTEFAILAAAFAELAADQDHSARLHMILSRHATDMITWIASDRRVAYVSPASREILGYSPEELTHERLMALASPEDQRLREKALDALWSGTQDTAMLERRVRHKDGHWVWLEVAYRLVRDPVTQCPTDVVTVSRDITAWRQAAERLRESEAILRLVADNATDMIVLLDHDMRRKYVSPACFTLFGLTQEDMMAQADFRSGMHPDELPDVMAKVQALRGGERFVSMTYRRQHRDGHYIWVNARASRLDAEQGFVMVIRDIGELKQAEAELRQTNRWLTLAEDIAGLGHWQLKLPERRVTWSPQIYRIFEEHPARPLPTGEALLARYHPDDRPRLRQALRDMEAHGTSVEMRARLLARDGTVRHLHIRAVPELGEDGAVEGLFGIMMDVTDQVSAQAALREARDAAEAAQAVLRDLALEDALTGLANRRRFDATLADQLRRAARDDTAVALALFDVDHFKKFNDRYGHVAGDDCLRALGVAVLSCLKRPSDLAARYGGEEFAVLLPQTDPAGAEGLAEEICLSVRSLRMAHADSPHGVVTISVGVATAWPARQEVSAADLIRMADSALYRAKGEGRDTVRVHHLTDPPGGCA